MFFPKTDQLLQPYTFKALPLRNCRNLAAVIYNALRLSLHDLRP